MLRDIINKKADVLFTCVTNIFTTFVKCYCAFAQKCRQCEENAAFLLTESFE